MTSPSASRGPRDSNSKPRTLWSPPAKKRCDSGRSSKPSTRTRPSSARVMTRPPAQTRRTRVPVARRRRKLTSEPNVSDPPRTPSDTR